MDLVRSAQARGYKVTTAQVSCILSREQEGGVDAVIAIAHGLGVPREEVFRRRGWLLRTPAEIVTPPQDAAVARLAHELDQLPLGIRGAALKVMQTVLDSFREVAGIPPKPRSD